MVRGYLDFTIAGIGFFQLQKPDGSTAYTRKGCFSRDTAGNIVAANGWKLLPGLTIPADATDVSASADGTVTAVYSKQPWRALGQIELATFHNPEGLKRADESTIFEVTDDSGPPILGSPGRDQFGKLVSGSLEMSNVDATSEMITLLQLSRWFEGVSGAIQVIYGPVDKRSAK